MIGSMIQLKYGNIHELTDYPTRMTLTGLTSNLVTNGSFAGSTGWTYDVGWDFTAPRATALTSYSGIELSQALTMDTSKVYRVQFSLGFVASLAWTCKVEIGGHTMWFSGTQWNEAFRDYSFEIQPTVASTEIKFTAYNSTGASFTVDTVAVSPSTTTKNIRTQDWYKGGLLPDKGNYDAPTDAQSPWYIG